VVEGQVLINGAFSEVGGTILKVRSTKTVSERRQEIQRVIFSPESDGRTKTLIARKVIVRDGKIR